MSCDNDWTIKFRGVNDGDPFEIRPISMSLKQSRQEYDFFRATLDWEVGEQMKPHTRYEDGKLYGLTPVDVCYNGTPIQRLVFRPDWVDYGNENTHLQLHDLHKALADGVIDEQRESVSLRNIYTEVVNKANNRLIDEIKFTVPDNNITDIYGETGVGGVLDPSEGEQANVDQRDVAADDTKKLIDAKYAVDFDEISPERAIQRLNKKFRINSWVNHNGLLIVGLPEAKEKRHLAASRDERVWRYKDPSISHGREPIKTVIAEGAWVDEPGIEIDPRDWFDKGGTKDVKAMGIATRKDVDYGKEIYVKSTKAKRDAIPNVAEFALKQEMKKQNAGGVEIDPELSGTQVSNPIEVSVGDTLHLVPSDNFFDNPGADSGQVGDEPDNREEVCGDMVNNEAYLITGIEHNVTKSGDWQIHLDLNMNPDVAISTSMTYFNPLEEEWVDESEINEDDELKDADSLIARVNEDGEITNGNWLFESI